MESSPGDLLVVADFNTQQGGKAGTWDREEHANEDMPTSGKSPLSLDEVVLNIAISPAGKIILSDYFDPYEYVPMGAGGQDLGSGGVALLVPTVFIGTGFHASQLSLENWESIGPGGISVVILMDTAVDSLTGSDNILQPIIAQRSIFAGPGSCPLEGGWIPTTTLLHIKAKPVNGILTPIPIPPTGGLNQFQCPNFEDVRLYVLDINGSVICSESPVALPLQYTQPVDFD
ncbi:uncharacterized protein EAE98_008840 [Botrytis deweyae]|uniref:Endonuclease/exonuclease/phosphatase domain-containing protein n=1 Tax=Botrytis deweyae TaxID=2478750 RepID=A0ABQ7ID85_9HELO|nr:uncharacterized protein EAE98_008840 [Botrytis deweyae]KAF7920811.1 hypothetical protein EAE98_008840 [Botrytis deweyae]